MMTLILPIEYYRINHRGVDYFGGRQYVDAILTLKSIPAMSENERKPNFGRWLSTNRFLGKELEGDFYVTRIKSWDDQRFWPVPDRNLKNPVGKFFDSSDNFLTLYNFAPNEMQTTWGHCHLQSLHESIMCDVWRNAYAQRRR